MKTPVAVEKFQGFTPAALGFFTGLAKNNRRDWFLAHKEEFERACRDPFQKLTEVLFPPDGAEKISRIYRDVRFSKDKSPYHTHISTVVNDMYFMLSASGLYVGTGIYMPEPKILKKLRDAIVDDNSGRKLSEIVKTLSKKGFAVETHERVNTTPRGYSADHPRIDFLRMKDVHAGKTLEPGVVTSKKVQAQVERACEELSPLKEWLYRYVGAAGCP